eukprot:450848_1
MTKFYLGFDTRDHGDDFACRLLATKFNFTQTKMFIKIILILLTILPKFLLSTKILVIHVDKTNKLPITQQNGTTWSSAYSSLHYALNISNDNQIIWITKGTYYTTQQNNKRISFSINSKYGIKIYGEFNGFETSLSERELSNNTRTVLSGNNNTYHVMQIINSTHISINDITVSNGYNTLPYPNGYGAGLVLTNSHHLNINNVRVVHNKAGGYGGGIYTYHSDNISINNTIFDHNTAE